MKKPGQKLSLRNTMSPLTRSKSLFVLIGDIVALYSALGLALLLRYGKTDAPAALDYHLLPFSILFILWLFLFYISDLYHIRELRTGPHIIQGVATVTIVATAISMVIFYFFGTLFALTPKTSLLLFSLVFITIDCAIRFLITKLFLVRYSRINLMILGSSPHLAELEQYLKENPQLGYDVAHSESADNRQLGEEILKKNIGIVVIVPDLLQNKTIIKNLYYLLSLNTEIVPGTDFYERVMGKIPLGEVNEDWFVKTVNLRHTLYDTVKRLTDIILAAIAGIIFSPLMLVIALLIRATSPGPALYAHTRMGQGGNPFTLYKFRSMKTGSQGPSWTVANDQRITPVGKILRRTHLDELPQLWNIFKGDLSLIGPRAENLELAQLYGSKLPHYDIRHLLTPGLTGWAQLNYKPSASIEEAFEKLKYDIYYVKNRNFILDVLILLKTIRYLFIRHG